MSKTNMETIINRSNDYIKEGYNENTIYWLLGQKNRQLALKSNSGILEDKFKIFIRGYTDEIHPSKDIIDIKHNTDIFRYECEPFYSIIKYKSIVEFREKLKLCRKLAKDIKAKNLDILKIVDIILEGKELRHQQNIYKDKILKLQNKKDYFFIDIFNNAKIEIDKKLINTIEKYNCAKNKYMECYDIDINTLKYITNEIVELNGKHGLIPRRVAIKNESIANLQPWNKDIYI